MSHIGVGRRFLTLDGVRLHIAEWARRVGVDEHTIKQRVGRLGWSVRRALTTPARAIAPMVHHCTYCGARGHHVTACPDSSQETSERHVFVGQKLVKDGAS